jgi:Galactose oxidase, central domain
MRPEQCGEADAEVYEPSSEKFVSIGEMSRQRDNHSATLLPDGTALIAGGETTNCDPRGCSFGGYFAGTTTTVESYDPSTGKFTAIGNMAFPRGGHTATLLPNGTVLLAGGYGYAGIGKYSGAFSSAEIYTPPVPVLAPVSTGLRFDRSSVSASNSFTADFAGSNVTADTFFDVRFTYPGSNISSVSMNWQKGLTSSHTVAPDTAQGVWTINGVRPHRFESDHTGNFFPVTAAITVGP